MAATISLSGPPTVPQRPLKATLLHSSGNKTFGQENRPTTSGISAMLCTVHFNNSNQKLQSLIVRDMYTHYSSLPPHSLISNTVVLYNMQKKLRNIPLSLSNHNYIKYTKSANPSKCSWLQHILLPIIT